MDTKKEFDFLPICYIDTTIGGMENISRMVPALQKTFNNKALIIPVLNNKPTIDIRMIDMKNNVIKNVFKE